MSVNNIGIQMIEPKTGTTPRSLVPPPGRGRDGNQAVVAADAVVRQGPPSRPAPPPPGMGNNVDKST